MAAKNWASEGYTQFAEDIGASLGWDDDVSVVGEAPRGIEEVSRSLDSGVCDAVGWTAELGVLEEPKVGRKERHDERVL
jgi:hypothetical protein